MRIAAIVLLLCATASADVTGRWLVTYDRAGVPQWYTLDLVQKGTQLTGKFDTDPLTGTLVDGKLAFVGKDSTNAGTDTIEATVDGDSIKGQMTLVFGDDAAHPVKSAFTAEKIVLHPGKPQRRPFTPTQFYREFSAKNAPVMHVGVGDTIVTSTVDAGGMDAKGDRRSPGGNPQTGPFYIDGAIPGDILVVKVTKLRLNRDYAISDDGIVDRALEPGLAVKSDGLGTDVRWKLDRVKNLGTSELPGKHLAAYTVPLRPMLGCIATAVGINRAAPPTQDSGAYGGNLDFNEIVEGTTVYLPVANPGALLYFGDGHAAQGDGELNGDALETSLDVEITVDLIPAKRFPGPRVESATHLMALGYAGSLDDSLKAATANMASWLVAIYGLTPSEVAQVLGTSSEYRVAEVADRNAGVALMLKKDRLRTVKK